MGRDKMFDPAFQKAFTEAIHNEDRIRLKWHLETSSRPRTTRIESDEEDSEEENEKLESSASKAKIRGVVSKRKGSTQDTKKQGEDEDGTLKKLSWPASKSKASITKIAQVPSVMRPVDKETKLLLYQGLSHEEEGRYQYLKKRNKLDPEVKYRFPICSSWEYGWRYGIKQEPLPQCEYGRHQIIKNSFYRPNDVQLRPKD